MATNNTANNLIYGRTNGLNAPTGYVGEYQSVIVANPGIGNPGSGTPFNVTNFILQPGDWMVWGEIGVTGGSSTNITLLSGVVTPTSATGGNTANNQSFFALPNSYAAGAQGVWTTSITSVPYLAITPCDVNITVATTYYLVAVIYNQTAGASAYGKICARRI